MKLNFVAVLVFLSFGVLFAQPRNAKPYNPFTEDDWNKLSQHTKDSINKKLFDEWKAENQINENAEEAYVNHLIEEGLKNVNNVTNLSLSSFPKSHLPDDIIKFKNLEEFSCQKSPTLDLTYLFNQLAQLPKLKKLNLTGGSYKVLPDNIKSLSVT